MPFESEHDCNIWLKAFMTIVPFKGTGKTTLVSNLVRLLSTEARVLGFFTEEVRKPGIQGRFGFDIVSIKDPSVRLPLARLTAESSGRLPTVGRYSVLVDQFEKLAIPCLQVNVCYYLSIPLGLQESLDIMIRSLEDTADTELPLIVFIDEIGKMEAKSRSFCMKLDEVLSATRRSNLSCPVCVVATIPASTHPDGKRGIYLVDNLLEQPGTVVHEVRHRHFPLTVFL